MKNEITWSKMHTYVLRGARMSIMVSTHNNIHGGLGHINLTSTSHQFINQQFEIVKYQKEYKFNGGLHATDR